MWLVLVALVALTALSVVGAFLGTDRAHAMFNSIPLAAYWFAMLALLAAGLYLFKRLIRSPGLLAAHLGPLLILAGGMYSSDAGHRFARNTLGSKKITEGYIPLPVTGGVDRQMLDKSYKKVIGHLPFSLGLRKAWEEHYTPWRLAVWPSPTLEDGKLVSRPAELIDWAVGEEIAVPHTEFTLKVLQYLPGHRIVFPEKLKGTLHVTGPEGETKSIPAEVGKTARLAKANVTLKIAKAFTHAVVHFEPHKHASDTGRDLNPVLEVALQWPDNKTTSRLVAMRASPLPS